MRLSVGLLVLTLTCSAYTSAGGWEEDEKDWDDHPLGKDEWWEGDDKKPSYGDGYYGGHGKLPSWLWFFMRGRQGLDGRDGRKGDMGDKGDCGDQGPQGERGPKGYKGPKGYPGIKGIEGVGEKGDDGEEGEDGEDGVDATGQAAPITRVYTHWGTLQCPTDANVFEIYSGLAGTSFHNNAGAGANHICLNSDFDFNPFTVNSRSTTYGSVVGVEYKTSINDPLNDVGDYNVPCAVCLVITNAIYMQPGTNECPNTDDWDILYTGYIMSEWQNEGAAGDRASDNYRSEYICVDSDADVIPDSSAANIEARLSHVHVDCTSTPGSPSVTGILDCGGGDPAYEQGQLSCVVCKRV